MLCLIWGSTWLAIKYGLDDAPPLWSVSLRFLLASLILVVINRIRKIKYPNNFREIIRLALPGLILYAIPYMMVYGGEQYVSSALTAVLFASLPFYVAGYSIFLLRTEKPNIYHWLGLVVGFSGVFIVFYDSLMTSQFVFWGSVLIVGSAAVSALGTVVIRAYFQKTDVTLALGLQLAAGAVVSLVVAAIFEPLSDFHVTAKSVGALVYLAVFGSVIAFSGYYWLLKRMKVLNIAMIAFITPVLAVFLGYILRGETFSAFAAVGAVLILGGLILVIKK